MLQAGEQIGPYTLVRQLGRGGFGLVWLAERRGAFATTQVALKLALDDEPNLTALAQESRLWAQLGVHNNVLPIIEADKYGDYMVLVSEYAPDGSLDGWLKKQGGAAPSIELATSMTIGILNGLEHLHSKKIIHRDLKPANILLQGETPRLADFGLARVLKTTMQSTGVAGTPAYMAPEVFSGERFVESDLWSVGVILYQLLSGRLPFPQTDVMALLGAIANRNPDPLPDYVPSQLTQIIAKALQKNIGKRFQSATEMRSTLQQVVSKGNISVVNAQIEDERPTAILDTVPGIGMKGFKQVLETLPDISKESDGNGQVTQIINENTVGKLNVFNTQKQVDSPTRDFAQSLAIAKTKAPIEPIKRNNHRMYETLVVSVVVAVMLSFTFLKGNNYNAVVSNIRSSEPILENTKNAKLMGFVDAVGKVDTANEVIQEDIIGEVDVIDEQVKCSINENEKLVQEIEEKSSSLEEQMEKVVDSNKKKSLKKRFDVIQDKLADLNSFDPNAKSLYRAYLMHLDSLNIETRSYLMPSDSIASSSKKLNKKDLEEKNEIERSAKSLEKKISLLPESKVKAELRGACNVVIKDLDKITFAYLPDFQSYKTNLEELGEKVEEMSIVTSQVISVDNTNNKKQNGFTYARESSRVPNFSYTREVPKPPKPPKPLIENSNGAMHLTIPYAVLTNVKVDSETLKKFMLTKKLPQIQGFEFLKDGIVITPNKIFSDKKREEAFKNVKTNTNITQEDPKEN